MVGVVVAKLNAAHLAARTGDIPQNVNFAVKGERGAGLPPPRGRGRRRGRKPWRRAQRRRGGRDGAPQHGVHPLRDVTVVAPFGNEWRKSAPGIRNDANRIQTCCPESRERIADAGAIVSTTTYRAARRGSPTTAFPLRRQPSEIGGAALPFPIAVAGRLRTGGAADLLHANRRVGGRIAGRGLVGVLARERRVRARAGPSPEPPAGPGPAAGSGPEAPGSSDRWARWAPAPIAPEAAPCERRRPLCRAGHALSSGGDPRRPASPFRISRVLSPGRPRVEA